MRKIILTFVMITMLFILNGCSKSNTEVGDPNNISPTSAPEVTLPAEDTTDEVTPVVTEAPSVNDNQEDVGEIITIADYYPLKADTEYIYVGKGMNTLPTTQLQITLMKRNSGSRPEPIMEEPRR